MPPLLLIILLVVVVVIGCVLLFVGGETDTAVGYLVAFIAAMVLCVAILCIQWDGVGRVAERTTSVTEELADDGRYAVTSTIDYPRRPRERLVTVVNLDNGDVRVLHVKAIDVPPDRFTFVNDKPVAIDY